MRLLTKLTLEPGRFGPEDVAAARAHGVRDQAIADAIFVCALFNIIVRCADALDFEVPEMYSGAQLLERGYLSLMGEAPNQL